MDEPGQQSESRSARRASKTRQRLLDAALYVFNAKGIEGCIVEDITESADVGKGTFYRYFLDKVDAFRTLLELAIADLISRMPAEGSPAVSVEACVTELLDAHALTFRDRQDLFMLFLQGQAMVATRGASVPGLEAPFTQYISAMERRIAPLFPAPQQAGQARRVACLVAAMVSGTLVAGLSIHSSKHEIAGNLDLARQAVVAGMPPALRCAV